MKNGFTLSETLITIGILGVIMALTIPNLIAFHKKVVIESKLKTFYTIMNQALISNIPEYGDFSNWNDTGGRLHYGAIQSDPQISDIEFIDKYLAQYLEIVKIENVLHSGIANFGLVTCTLKNGLQFTMYDGGSEYWVFTDNNPKKIKGKNAFLFLFVPRIQKGYEHLWKGHQNKGIEPYAYGSNYLHYCKENGNACAKLIQQNNWKIPDDYPIYIN